MSLPTRFWVKVNKTPTCWLWTGSLRGGYAQYWLDGKPAVAHVVAYTDIIGAVPQGMQLDHLCRERRCVNPAHLEPVTQRENILRGASIVAQQAKRTHCKYGHPLSQVKNQRLCRTCVREKDRRSREGRLAMLFAESKQKPKQMCACGCGLPLTCFDKGTFKAFHKKRKSPKTIQ